MKTENWCGYDIRVVEKDGEWWAVLKDVCDALDLKMFKVSQRLDPDMMTRIKVEVSNIPSKDNRSRGENESRWMLAVNEVGIYEALYSSRKLEARKFRRWSDTVLQRLRKHVGLEGYKVMRMTEESVQDEIDHFLDKLFYDEETRMLKQRVTVAGGDVEQVPFEF